MELVIFGETPSKKNSKVWTRGGKLIPSKQFRAWHDYALFQVTQQIIRDKLEQDIDYPCIVTLKFYHGDKRRRDSDNGTSSILDMLQDCRILHDDCWEIVRVLNVFNFYEKNAARCEIAIKKIEGTI